MYAEKRYIEKSDFLICLPANREKVCKMIFAGLSKLWGSRPGRYKWCHSRRFLMVLVQCTSASWITRMIPSARGNQVLAHHQRLSTSRGGACWCAFPPATTSPDDGHKNSVCGIPRKRLRVLTATQCNSKERISPEMKRIIIIIVENQSTWWAESPNPQCVPPGGLKLVTVF